MLIANSFVSSLAHSQGRSVAILASEGTAFVESDPGRLEMAYAAGVRSIGLVHYRPSRYGDNQTSPAQHGGLTPLGKELVAEMNRLGILIDTAHASFETVRDIIEMSTNPVMLSHSHLAAEDVPHPRLLSPEHAELIAGNGGIIGAWPAGIVSQSLSDYITEIMRLIDLVGIDHVAVGTDLDANYKPVLTDYRQFPEVAAMLLARGLTRSEVERMMGRNFLRVFSSVTNDG